MPDAADYITIVSGLPRSGTSLMMQMLRAGGVDLVQDGRRKADAHNPEGYYEDERVKRLKEDGAWLTSIQGSAIKIISYLLPTLASDLPCRVILMDRPLIQVIASQNSMLGVDHGDPVTNAALMSLLEKQQDTARAWLEQYCGPGRYLEVPYPDLIANPALWSARINQVLDGRLDESAMITPVLPALYRHREAADGTS